MGIIYLSMLFKWYSIDFGTTKLEILKWIYENMAQDSGDVDKTSRKEQLGKIIGENDSKSSKFKLKYIDYDWGNNAKKNLQRCLRGRELIIEMRMKPFEAP